MIAVTNDLISSVVTDLDTDCEILWVQIDLIGTKSLHIGSFYRPPNSDMTALDNLNLSLERLTHITNGNIWLGGGFQRAQYRLVVNGGFTHGWGETTRTTTPNRHIT